MRPRWREQCDCRIDVTAAHERMRAAIRTTTELLATRRRCERCWLAWLPPIERCPACQPESAASDR